MEGELQQQQMPVQQPPIPQITTQLTQIPIIQARVKKDFTKLKSMQYAFIYLALSIVLAVFYAVVPKIGAVFIVFCPGMFLTAIWMKWLSQAADKNEVNLTLARCRKITLFMVCFFVWEFAETAIALALATLHQKTWILQSTAMQILFMSVVAPISEEIIKFCCILAAVCIFYCAEKSRYGVKEYYFVLMIGICLGAAFGMYENFLYLAAPEWAWDIKELAPALPADANQAILLLAVLRCTIPLPLHTVCIIHLDKLQNGKIKCSDVAKMLCIPLALHVLLNATGFFGILIGPIGGFLAFPIFGLVLFLMVIATRHTIGRFKEIAHPREFEQDAAVPIVVVS